MSRALRLQALLLLLAAALALPAPPAAAEGTRSPPAWTWPVLPQPEVARPYRGPPTPYAAGHRGIDLVAPEGTPVLSPDDGTVHFAGMVGDRPVLSIQHAGGLLSSFEPVETTLAVGSVVHRGEEVGTLAPSAGHCPGDCLHLGARVEGRYLSPLVLLGGVPRAVLLPLGTPPN